MKRTRILLSLLLVCVLLLGAMPAAFAVECSSSPSGYHYWQQRYSGGSWLDICTWQGWSYEECYYCHNTRNWQWTTNYWHVWGDWYISQQATCQEQGVRQRKCSDCGKIESEYFLADHSYGPWDILVEATDHSQGSRKHSCTVCGHEEREDYDPEGTLRRGDKGDRVRDLQRLLIDRGFLPHRSVDGDFGEQTENAVKSFQQSVGLTADGVAWPQTIKRLDPNADFSAPVPQGCFCSMAAAENGGVDLTLGFCEEHAALHAAASGMPAKNRRILWTTSVDDEYAKLLKGMETEELKDLAEAERTAYETWLSAYEGCLQALYPDDAERADSLLSNQLMRHSVMLCWLNHPEQPLPELLAALPESDSAAPMRCTRENSAEKDALTSNINMCEEHRLMASAAAAVPASQARAIWRLTEADLIESLQDCPADVQAEHEAFAAWLDAYDALIKQLRPDEPEAANKIAAEAIMEYVVERCAWVQR